MGIGFNKRLILILFTMPVSALSIVAQDAEHISNEAFLELYRVAVPKLEKSLFRNKTIVAECITHNPYPTTPDKKTWRIEVDFKSNDDRFCVVKRMTNQNSTSIAILRPNRYYQLSS